MNSDLNLTTVAEYDNIALGNTIRILREKQHLTQAELAARSSVSAAQICKLENGIEKKKIPLETLIKISPHLCVSLDYLLASSITQSYNDYEHFFDFEGKEIDLYWRARDLYFFDSELFLLLSSSSFLSDVENKNFIKKWIKINTLIKQINEKNIIRMFDSLKHYCTQFIENILAVIHDTEKKKGGNI